MEHTRLMSAKDPVAPQNIIRFNFKEMQYKLDATVDQCACHFEMEGNLLHRDTEDGKRIVAEQDAKRVAAERAQEMAGLGSGGDGAEMVGGEPKKLRNQFNYSERASQTFNHPPRERETVTEPPPSIAFNGQVNGYEVFDSYVEDIERQRLVKEKAAAATAKKPAAKEEKDEHEDGETKEVAKEADVVHSAAMSKSLKIMERMVNQNTYDEIAQDFRYWDDQSDAYKEGEGTLLPLWKFWTEKVLRMERKHCTSFVHIHANSIHTCVHHTACKSYVSVQISIPVCGRQVRRKHVTALCWNPEYDDLFAVGYGSYDFMKQGSGVICCYSLKNPSHPEYSFTTETGVMCLDFHPQHSSLLAVGCYDGTVMIFDIRNKYACDENTLCSLYCVNLRTTLCAVVD